MIATELILGIALHPFSWAFGIKRYSWEFVLLLGPVSLVAMW